MKFKFNKAWAAGARLKFKDEDGKKIVVETVSDQSSEHVPKLFIDVDGSTVTAIPVPKAVKLAKAILKEFNR